MKRIALFSSYFQSSSVPFYVHHFLSLLRPHVDQLIYITAADLLLSSEELSLLCRYADEVVQVENGGYDFGMWQKVLKIQHKNIGQYDELCLVNDSCVCFDSLNSYFAWHSQCSADVTGMALSYDVARHLQSFFLCVKDQAFGDVVNYLKNLDLHDSSFEDVIESGELGLSRMLQNKGFSIQGFFEMPESDQSNPMYSRCVDLIRLGIPLVKKKLFLSYSSLMLKNLLARKNSWRHQALIDEIKNKTHMDDDQLNKLFAWFKPRQMTAKERVRLARLRIKNIVNSLLKIT